MADFYPMPKIPIPDYLLKSVLRHYKTLSRAKLPNTDIKSRDAARLAQKEIVKIERIIQNHQSNV